MLVVTWVTCHRTAAIVMMMHPFQVIALHDKYMYVIGTCMYMYLYSIDANIYTILNRSGSSDNAVNHPGPNYTVGICGADAGYQCSVTVLGQCTATRA